MPRSIRLGWWVAGTLVVGSGLLAGLAAVGFHGLLIVAVSAGPVGCLAATMIGGTMASERRLPTLWQGAAACVLGAVAFVGLVKLVDWVTGALLLSLSAAVVWAQVAGGPRRRAGRIPRPPRGSRVTATASPGGQSGGQSGLQPVDDCLTTADLCQMWRSSYTSLQRAGDPRTSHRIVLARQYCLDELERRDPDGFLRWLKGARAAGDPSRYLADSMAEE